MSAEIKNRPIERESPEGRRWMVISCAEVAIRALQKMSIEPTPGAITALIQKAKSNPRTWEILTQKAQELRESEFKNCFPGGDSEAKNRALYFLHKKYAEIDGDQNRNCSYLDDIVLDGDVDESQKTTPQR